MRSGMTRVVVVLAMAIALLYAGPAAAVDAPKWVAAIFVDAQRSVGLRWMAIPGVTGYKVLRSEKEGADYKELTTSVQPQYFDQTVEAGSTYFYVLQAVAGAEVSAKSAEKSVRIPGEKQKKILPPEWAKDPLLNESTEFGKVSFKVGLVWNKMNDAIAYNVYKSTTSGKEYALLLSGAENQAIDTAVEAGKTYYYVITALDGSFQETPYSVEKKVLVEAVKKVVEKKRVKLVIAGRATKPLWKKTKGEENGKFGFFEPFDIDLDESRDILYATSNASQQVYALNATTGELIRVIGERGKEPGQFLYPLGLALDDDGNLYVVDRQKISILKFNSDGKFLREFPLEAPAGSKPKVGEQGDMPMDVLVDSKSGDIFVCDRGLNSIWVLDDKGKFQRFIGTPGTELGQIQIPEYMRWDKDGNIVLTNSNQTWVSTYNKDTGAHLRSWGERKPGVGSFLFIGGFDYDQEGNIVIVDKSSGMAQGFLNDGRYLFNLANEKGDGGMEVFSPKTLVIDKKNRVFLCEGLVDRISAFQIVGPVPPPQEEAAAPTEPAKK